MEEIHKWETKHKSNLDLGDAKQLETLRVKLSICLHSRVKDKYRFFARRFRSMGTNVADYWPENLKNIKNFPMFIAYEGIKSR